jgi:hypothetical protein
MRDNRILFGVLGAGLLWSAAAIAQGPFVPTTFYAPVDLTNTTPRQVYWQTESSSCNASDRNGPDTEKYTSDDFGLDNATCTAVASPWFCCTGVGTGTCPVGNPPLSASVFILDPGCAILSSDVGAEFDANLAVNSLPGLPVGTDLSNGFIANFSSDGTTATVTVPSDVWGPVVANTVNSPGLVTVVTGTPSDYVFTIDIASGDVASFGWTANADTVLGPAALDVVLLPGTTANWYSSEATQAVGASGATTWACGTGGFIAQPADNPLADPGSLGTCPPNLVNPSPTTTNTPYDPVKGSLFANASTKVLGLTPRAWAPLDGRLSELTPEPGALLLGASALVALGVLGRRRDA